MHFKMSCAGNQVTSCTRLGQVRVRSLPVPGSGLGLGHFLYQGRVRSGLGHFLYQVRVRSGLGLGHFLPPGLGLATCSVMLDIHSSSCVEPSYYFSLE